MIVTEILGGLILILVGIYFYFKHVLYNYWENRKIVSVEQPTVPFGNIARVVTSKISIGEIIAEFYLKHKTNRYVGIYTFHKPSLIICDPDLIRIILTKDFAKFHDRGLYCNEKVDPLSGHLFFLSGTKWKNLRAKLSPTFTSGKLKFMFTTLKDCADKLIEHLQSISEKDGIVDMRDTTARLGTDVIVSIAFGLDSNCLENPDSEFRKWGKKSLESRAVHFMLMFFAPKMLDFFRVPSMDKKVCHFFSKAFKDNFEYRTKNNIVRADFMNLLIQLIERGYVDSDNGKTVSISESASGKITLQEAIAQAFVFFIAGFETTSSTITYCLYELSRMNGQKIQEKVRQEIDQVLEKHNGNITYDSIQEMTYLQNAIDETLRMYPPVPILNRVCTQDVELSNADIKITQGLDIIIPVLGLHRDPDIYPEPHKFDPERFNEENSAARHPYSYLPFGEGPRICIGARFGLIEAKIVLVSMLSKFKFSLSSNTPEPMEFDPGTILLTPKSDIQLCIESR